MLQRRVMVAVVVVMVAVAVVIVVVAIVVSSVQRHLAAYLKVERYQSSA